MKTTRRELEAIAERLGALATELTRHRRGSEPHWIMVGDLHDALGRNGVVPTDEDMQAAIAIAVERRVLKRRARLCTRFALGIGTGRSTGRNNNPERKYGERARAAAEGLFGREFRALADCAMVSPKFETSRRREVLSFTHHREVAAQSADEADALSD